MQKQKKSVDLGGISVWMHESNSKLTDFSFQSEGIVAPFMVGTSLSSLSCEDLSNEQTMTYQKATTRAWVVDSWKALVRCFGYGLCDLEETVCSQIPGIFFFFSFFSALSAANSLQTHHFVCRCICFANGRQIKQNLRGQSVVPKILFFCEGPRRISA